MSLKQELEKVIDDHHADWDKEDTSSRQVSRMADCLIEAIQEYQRFIPNHAVCFFRDGAKWVCVFGDFIDLQVSPAGFGDSFDMALADLMSRIEK